MPAKDEDSIEVSDESATFREAREYARGALDVEHQDAHRIAGLVEDDEVREVLMWMSENFEPFEDEDGEVIRSFWETEFAGRATRKYATNTLDSAIREGNLTQTAYMSGLPSYKSDVSGLHAINQLADWLVHSEQCKLIYLAALMGRGKTDLALTMMEVVADHFDRVDRSTEVEVPTPEFAANFEVRASGDHEVREIHTFEDLKEWAERGNSDMVRWFIFDEASTELTAQSGANAQKVAERMSPFVKKMRKMGVNLLVIGHDKGDVHPAIRSIADFVSKPGLKRASFYAGISKREPVGHLFDLDGIPPTSWEFDTDDTADWSWGDETEESSEDVVEGMTEEEFATAIKERAGRLYALTPDSVRLEDVAEAVSTDEFSISSSTVSRYAPDDLDAAKAAENRARA
ncbi:hypothetical protein [Haloarcula sp. CGMCC 1.2071]|uniref:hypothetical protein n=1 Tax=Haloarcula sp. CGMCC 1.2071 TaxID=3111454 RepID=UPI00300E9988